MDNGSVPPNLDPANLDLGSVDPVTDALDAADRAGDGTWMLAAADGLRDDERGVLQSLGAAVVARWSELPRDIQKLLFETAAHGNTDTDAAGLRGHLARFLHESGNPN